MFKPIGSCSKCSFKTHHSGTSWPGCGEDSQQQIEMLVRLHDHQTLQSKKPETYRAHNHDTSAQHTPTFKELPGRWQQVLTLVAAAWAGSHSCLAAARVRLASRPARHALLPRSPSTRGDLVRNTPVSVHTHHLPHTPISIFYASLGGKKQTNIVVEELKTFFANFHDLLLLLRFAITLFILSLSF